MIQTIEPAIDIAKPYVPAEVQAFAVAKGVNGYLDAVIDLTRQAFSSSALCVSLGQDAEDETHQYIALDIDASSLTSEDLLTGQRCWSSGMGRLCSSRCGVYFVLGWR